MIEELKPIFGKLTHFAKKRLGFTKPPKLFLRKDEQNAESVLGKTAFYDPNLKSITIFFSKRHPKDILRSYVHELVHHCQNERGEFKPEKIKSTGKNYAQECPHMRKMEEEAYLKGNMCFRDWEDSLDNKLQYKIKILEQRFLKENKIMATKLTKNLLIERIRNIINENKEELFEVAAGTAEVVAAVSGEDEDDTEEMERQLQQNQNQDEDDDKPIEEGGCGAAGFRTDDEDDDFLEEDLVEEEAGCEAHGDANCQICPSPLSEEEIEESGSATTLVPNHYCIHHGGIQYEGKIIEAEAVRHMEPDSNGFVSHYDMKLPNGKIIEDVAAEDIQVTKASLLSEHGNKSAGKRHDKTKKKKGGKIPKTEKEKKFAKLAPPKNRITFADKIAGATKVAEEKIQTPEQENNLYESRFTQRNTKLFEKLLKEWAK